MADDKNIWKKLEEIDFNTTQKRLLESQVQELDEENSKKVQQILEMPDEMIRKWVNISYQDLLKENSFERKKANPEKLKKELTEKVIENIEEENEKTNIIMEFVKNSQNKFILSQERLQALTDEQLNKLLFEVGQLLDKYQYATKEDRKRLRQQNPLPKFSNFPEDVQKAIKSKLSEENSIFQSQWAENINQGKINADVYKLTKWRHDNDYFSILQLVKHMIALEKDFRDENKKLKQNWKKVKIRNANEAVIFYEDENGNYKRLIKQSFAPWESVDVALKKVLNKIQWEYLKKNPEKNCVWPSSKCKYKKLINLDDKLDDILPEDFNTLLYDKSVSEFDKALFQAYKNFLESIQNISDEKWYLLDISDSRQGWATRRWNVLNTSNVFVKEENWEFVFSVIDPDVFNKDWKAKFEWKEQEEIILEKEIKSKEVLGFMDKIKAKLTWILTEITNNARDWVENNNPNKSWIKEKISKVAVAPKQEMYMNEILDFWKEKKGTKLDWFNISQWMFWNQLKLRWTDSPTEARNLARTIWLDFIKDIKEKYGININIDYSEESKNKYPDLIENPEKLKVWLWNHQFNGLEWRLSYTFLPNNVRIIVKDLMTKFPLVWKAIKKLDPITFDRWSKIREKLRKIDYFKDKIKSKSRIAESRRLKENVEKTFKNWEWVYLFPEWTRTKDWKLRKFHSSLYKQAIIESIKQWQNKIVIVSTDSHDTFPYTFDKSLYKWWTPLLNSDVNITLDILDLEEILSQEDIENIKNNWEIKKSKLDEINIKIIEIIKWNLKEDKVIKKSKN